MAELYGLDVRIAYDETMIAIPDADDEVDGVQVHLGEAPHVDFWVRNIADDNRIWYAVTQLGPREEFEGNGVVLWFKATALRPGIMPMTFSYAKIVNHDGYELVGATILPSLWDVGESTYLPVVGLSDTPKPPGYD